MAAFIRKKVIAFYIGKFSLPGFILSQFHRYKVVYRWIEQLRGLKLSSDILDVGSGAGSFLQELGRLGFTNLTGIDPFIEKEMCYATGIKILKKSMYEINKQYDLIILNHSFEHMDDPHSTFLQLHKLLKSDGQLLIRIPIADSFSWRKYGVSWYQIDAPRHFFLHTVRSISILAKRHGFDVLNVHYQSNESQFFNSEKHMIGRCTYDLVHFEPRLINKWRKYARWLNDINDGDQAGFLLSKKQ